MLWTYLDEISVRLAVSLNALNQICDEKVSPLSLNTKKTNSDAVKCFLLEVVDKCFLFFIRLK